MGEMQQVVREGWHEAQHWTTGTVRPERQFDYWCAFVNRAYLSWSIQRTRCDGFPAYIREGRFDGCRLTNLTSGHPRIKGTRGRPEIARDSDAFYNLLYIAEGAQHLVIDAREITLTEGQFVLWDTARPMVFVTGERLRQITFTVPHERLNRAVPGIGAYVGRPVGAAQGPSRLFADHLLSLDAHFGDLTRAEAPRILDATIALLGATLDACVGQPAADIRPASLRAIQADIERNLDDPELGPAQIADRHGISVRHLHRLFAAAGLTVASWILDRRLERCRAELGAADRAGTSITAIAFRWGLADSSSFSRAFRRRFGVSPRGFRAGRSAPDC
jgi:AraC-like DNA-binding protein